MAKTDPLRWMPLDTIDWLLDPEVAMMEATARGAYLDLLCRQWLEGSLPDDDEALRTLARVSVTEWSRIRDVLRARFQRSDDGRLRQKRCEKEKQKALELVEKFKQKTAKATQKRWTKRPHKPHKDQEVVRDASITHPSRIRDGSVTSVPGPRPKTIPIPSPPPLTPPQPEAGLLERELAEEAGPPPAGTTTVFDQQAEIEKLLSRYDELGEQAKTIGIAVNLCTEGMRPGGKVLFLRELDPFPTGQVHMAAVEFLKTANKPRQPNQYFLAMVRNCGPRWSAEQDEADRKREAKEQNRRMLEATKRRSEGERLSSVGDLARNILAKAVLDDDGLGDTPDLGTGEAPV